MGKRWEYLRYAFYILGYSWMNRIMTLMPKLSFLSGES